MNLNRLIPLIALLGLSACVNPFGEGSFDPNFVLGNNAYLALLNPADVALGTIAAGKETSRTLIVSNTGARTAEYLAPEVSATWLGFAGGTYPGTGGTCAKQLASGESCHLVMSISPPLPGRYETSLVVRYWDGESARALEIFVSAQADNGTFIGNNSFDQPVMAMLEAAEGTYVAGPFTGFGRTPAQGIIRLKNDSYEVDSSFQTAAGANGPVLTVASDDGSLYIGGLFTSYAGTAVPYVARLNANGSLDASFAPTSLTIPQTVRAIAVDPASGKVYVAYGSASAEVKRLNVDGSADSTFATVTLNGAVLQILVAPGASGDIYLGGTFTLVGAASRAALARVNSAGDLVGTFDAAIAGMAGSDSTRVLAMVPCPDTSGDIYLGGSFNSINGTSRFGIARINPEGAVVPSFAPTGTGFSSTVTAIAVIPGDGRLQVMGAFGSFNGNSRPGLVRLTDTGSLDSSFAPGVTFNTLDTATGSLIAHSDGSFHVGGTFTSYQTKPSPYFLRIDNEGNPDSRSETKVGVSNVNAVAALADGSGVYVGGSFTTAFGQSANYAARIGYNAEFDPSFAPYAISGAVNAVLAADDGTGNLYLGGSFSSRLMRLNSAGVMDASFTVSPTLSADVTKLIFVNGPSGQRQVLAVGPFTQRVVRFNSSGAIDSSFAASISGSVLTAAATSDGSGGIYVGGAFSTVGGTASSGIARLNWNGSRDTAFTVSTGFNGPIHAIHPKTDGSGKVLVGGQMTAYQAQTVYNIAVLNPNGTLDASAGLPAFTGGAVQEFVADSTGRIYVMGTFTSPYKYLARLKADGTLDTDFNPGTSFDVAPKSMSLIPDGSDEIYVGGSFLTYNGSVTNGLVRLKVTGALD